MDKKKALSFTLPEDEYQLWKAYSERRKPALPITRLIREAVAEKIQRETKLTGQLSEL